ncbi:MAG TPA: hypothetical protein VLQ79_11110, partial [Myxococcaceae bacterium]|nr:hypothetical protein [Myxococcaceae bacterium]
MLSSPPPPLPACARDGERIPPALASVVRRCLAKNPDDRFASLRELSRALDTAARAPVRRGPPRWSVAAGALALVLVGVAGVSVRVTRRAPALARVSSSGPVSLGTVAPVVLPAPARVDPEPETVVVTVVSDPAGARVLETATGRALGTTPLSASFPRSSAPTRLRLERSGRRPAEVDVVPESTREVHVSLNRAPRNTNPASGKVAQAEKHP